MMKLEIEGHRRHFSSCGPFESGLQAASNGSSFKKKAWQRAIVEIKTS